MFIFFTYTIFIIYFYFLFTFLGWVQPSLAYIFWAGLGPATQPGHWPKPVTGWAEGWCTREAISRLHQQCEGNLNYLRTVQMLIEQLNTNNERGIGRTCFWRWWRRLRCWWLLLSFDCSPFSPRCAPLSSPPLISQFLRWTSWESNGYADSLFFLYFYRMVLSSPSLCIISFFGFFAFVLAPVLPLFLLCFWVNFSVLVLYFFWVDFCPLF